MSVFRELKLRYKGENYQVTPSNRLLRRIEQEVSLVNCVMKINNGTPAISEIAFIASEFLREAGAQVDEDSVFAAIMADMEKNGGKMYRALVSAIEMAISPTEDVAKNSQAPQEGQK